ncbi:MAG: hypothetical protein C0594_04225 [Marinilabiliales bacterium]|nr:MAG: hypothetical protein C0594_04225 [Marinilabiliales bacterium]
MVIILFLLISIAVSLIIFSGKTLNYFVMKDWMEQNIYYYLITIGNWVIITALFFFAISILYYLAPAKKTRWRFISAGSTLSTVLIIIASIGFSYFVNNFGQYNKLYGSIGTIIVILLWLYFNSLALIIGFELNTSIINARSERHDINN